MKKQLNINAISNELKGASLFFSRPGGSPEPPPIPETLPLQQDPSPPHPTTTIAPIRTPSTPGTERTSRTGRPERMVPPPAKRQMKRHAFEIYLDQYQSLVRLAAEERMAGGPGSMSQMVRDALDRLIAEGRASQR